MTSSTNLTAERICGKEFNMSCVQKGITLITILLLFSSKQHNTNNNITSSKRKFQSASLLLVPIYYAAAETVQSSDRSTTTSTHRHDTHSLNRKRTTKKKSNGDFKRTRRRNVSSEQSSSPSFSISSSANQQNSTTNPNLQHAPTTQTEIRKSIRKSRTIGTKITSSASHGIRNRSIFYTPSKNKIFEKTWDTLGVDNSRSTTSRLQHTGELLTNPMRGRLYAKLQTKRGREKLLLYIPSLDNTNEKESNLGQIISLSTQWDLDSQCVINTPSLYAQRHTSSDTSIASSSLDQWIPIEGLFGIYMLPSGPHLVLITDSDLMYESPPTTSTNKKLTTHSSSSSSATPLLNFRRIRSMEIVPIPTSTNRKRHLAPILTRQQQSMEERQFRLLRHSLREHSFYYVPVSTTVTSSSSLGTTVVQDVTHSLQRSFSHWNEQNRRKKDMEHESLRLFFIKATSTASRDEDKMMKLSIDDSINNDIFSISTNSTHIAHGIFKVVDHVLLDRIMDTVQSVQGEHHNSTVMNSSQALRAVKILLMPLAMKRYRLDTFHENENQNLRASLQDRWWNHYLKHSPEPSNHHLVQQQPDSRFFWNEDCIQPILMKVVHDEKSTVLHCHQSNPYGVLLDHVIPVTSAFVGIQRNIQFSSSNKNTVKSDSQEKLVYDQLLISRRSKFRAGTRFTKRGSDVTGATANYAESEQICIIHDTDQDLVHTKGEESDNTSTEPNKATSIKEVYSHVQTRGSIPLRWSSPADIKYRPRVLIGVDPTAQANALWSHVVEQIALYSGPISYSNERSNNVIKNSKLVFVNLIDKHSDQGRLGRTFESVLSAVLDVYNESNRLNKSIQLLPNLAHHIWFDFHAECRNGRWNKLSVLLESVLPALDCQGYFCAIPTYKDPRSSSSDPALSWEIVSQQDGVVRTNCMDCLDRTNVCQALFGRVVLFKQFSERKGSIVSSVHRSPTTKPLSAASKRNMPLEYVIGYKQKPLSLPWKNGERAHRLLWADNADHISRLYAGTPALKGDFTRTGKRTKRGALDDGMNSLQRYYLNNFIDADRQEGMDLLTGYLKFDDSSDEIEDEEDLSTPEYNSKVTRLAGKGSVVLNWLSGDLQSQLRSSSALHHNNDFSPTEALRDIDRRSSSDHPWWDFDSLHSMEDLYCRSSSEKKKRVKALVKHKEATISDGRGNTLLALAVATQAPLATAIGIILLILPGILSSQ